jgi:hypothetical protein
MGYFEWKKAAPFDFDGEREKKKSESGLCLKR